MKIFLTALLITLPFIVLANAGSPIVWFNFFHLIFINALIGFIESEILSKYKLPNKTWIIIIANYISMIVGYYFIIPGLVQTRYGRDLWSGNSGDLLFGLVVSFFATLVIEYPFFVASLKDKKQKKDLFKPFFIANLVTNVAMTCIYFLFMKDSN